jgi:hypothetical protein
MRMKRLLLLTAAAAVVAFGAAAPRDPLRAGFLDPPPEARLRCYWWWLNGNVTKGSITRDLEEMRARGFGGVMLFDAGGAEQRGNHQVKAGPLFGSPAWRELFRHTLAEASRLQLEVSLNIGSGWNLGGPTVTPEQSGKVVTFSKTSVKGPARVDQVLAAPQSAHGFYRDIAVLAYPLRHGPGPAKRPIQQLPFKASFRETGGSMPPSAPLLFDLPAEPGEEDTRARDVTVVSDRMDAAGRFRWEAPAGDWEILRFGYTSSGSRVSTSSGEWQGLVLDYLDRDALAKYWKDVVQPVLDDVKPHLGKALKYLVTDSWELHGVNWTPRFAAEFRKRRGYDITPWLPVLAGRIVESRETSVRFLNDLRRTVGDLVADEHYSAFRDTSAQHGMGIHPESGGPHGAPLDALQCLGRSAFPQMEYWAKSPIHRVKDSDRFFVKQAASAAHIYGKTFVAAEGFTTIGPHWEESLWQNLKPTFDRALCEGLNRHIWHTVTASPPELGVPGQEYFAGTHFNPNVTWWKQSDTFLRYLNRGQFMMQQGLFVADVLYYYGDHVPNFVRMKPDDPAKVLPGYDYDVTNEEVLLTRVRVEGGKLVLPDGMSYRVLAMPDLPVISLPVLKKVRDLVSAGATVLGRRPERVTGLGGVPGSDAEVARIAAEVWGGCDGTAVRSRRFGKGRVVCAGTARELLTADRVVPDFAADAPALDYIHRRTPSADIYFVSNQSETPLKAPVTFRVSGKAPELWDALDGTVRRPAIYESTADGRVRLTLDLLPYGSTYVVFRRPAGTRVVKVEPEAAVWIAADGGFTVESSRGGAHALTLSDGRTLRATLPQTQPLVTLPESWSVTFASPAARPASRTLDRLAEWTQSPDPLLKYFSGTATYAQEIEVPASMLGAGKRVLLELGQLRELAQVRVNGRDLGVQWAPPFAVDVTGAVNPGRNRVEIAVTNVWANRVIGDAQLPEAQRTTWTNILQLTKDAQLVPSGLLGPVRLRGVAAGACGSSEKRATTPDNRAFGVLPNYRVADPSLPFEKLTSRRKLYIAYKDSTDWPILGTAAVYSLVYHAENQNPSFGQGTLGYAQRLGGSLVDQAVGNFMTEGFMPVLLRQDPRYFPKLTGSGWARLGYAMSRVFVCKNDKGNHTFNFSEVLGNSAAAAFSNVYYPDTRTARDNGLKVGIQIATDAASNVLKEFWPDIKRKLQQRKQR